MLKTKPLFQTFIPVAFFSFLMSLILFFFNKMNSNIKDGKIHSTPFRGKEKSKYIHCFPQKKCIVQLLWNTILRWKWSCNGNGMRNRYLLLGERNKPISYTVKNQQPHLPNSWWLNKPQVKGQGNKTEGKEGNEAAKWKRSVSAKVSKG